MVLGGSWLWSNIGYCMWWSQESSDADRRERKCRKIKSKIMQELRRKSSCDSENVQSSQEKNNYLRWTTTQCNYSFNKNWAKNAEVLGEKIKNYISTAMKIVINSKQLLNKRSPAWEVRMNFHNLKKMKKSRKCSQARSARSAMGSEIAKTLNTTSPTLQGSVSMLNAKV